MEKRLTIEDIEKIKKLVKEKKFYKVKPIKIPEHESFINIIRKRIWIKFNIWLD